MVRPDERDLAGQAGSGLLLDQLRLLQDSGLVHVEVAWRNHPLWSPFIRRLREACPQLLVGAASVVQREALAELADLDLRYAMSPCWDPILLDQARRQGILLVPGVFSPTEVMQAIRCGCRLVKLFPAATLGCRYWSRLLVPLGERPAVIAAGGLAVSDLEQWLSAGHDAVALGRRVIGPDGVDALVRDVAHGRVAAQHEAHAGAHHVARCAVRRGEAGRADAELAGYPTRPGTKIQ